jgi:hypothetical protein
MEASHYGLDLHPSDFYELAYPFDKASLANLAYFFRDRNFAADYFMAMVHWIDKLRETVDLWQSRWSGKDHGLPPMLYLLDKGNATVVYDSRAGEPVEHVLSDVELQILRALGRPKRYRDLAAELSHLPGLDPEKALDSLQARGLVFHERRQALSLVLPEKPSVTEFWGGWSWAA